MDALRYYPEIFSWKKTKDALYAVSIRFDWHNNRIGNEKSNITVKADHWDKKAREVMKANPAHQLKNQIIKNRLNKHENYFLRRRAFNLPVTKDLVKLYLKLGALESFYDYAESVIGNKILEDGKPYSDDTKRRYRDEIKRMKQYEPELSFRQLDLDFLTKYKQWLQNGYIKKDGNHLNENSVWKAFGFVRMVYNEAVRAKIILDDDKLFSTFDVGSYKTDYDKIKYLELSDLENLEKVLTSATIDELTRRVGWRFLSMCVSGMRISDAMTLNGGFFNDGRNLQIVPYKTRRHNN